MSPEFFIDRFPVRQDSVMTDDSPPMSLDEVHMIERQENERSRFKSSVLGLMSILK